MNPILAQTAAAVTIAAAAAAMIAMAAVPAFADDLDDRYPRVNVPAAEWMSVPELSLKLRDAGYDIREIERDDGVYEIEAMKDGARIEAHVHPATGEVLAWKPDND